MEEKSGKVITLKTIEGILRQVMSEEEMQPYKSLGNGLYKLPGGAITGIEGLKLFLNELEKSYSYEINSI